MLDYIIVLTCTCKQITVCQLNLVCRHSQRVLNTLYTCTSLYMYVQPKQFKLDVTRVWPPVTSCSFTHNLMCVTYQGPSGFTPHAPANLSSGDTPATGQPKGVVIYTNMAIPSQVSSNVFFHQKCMRVYCFFVFLNFG